MRMSVWGGMNFVTEGPMDVEEVAPGVGRIVCPECAEATRNVARQVSVLCGQSSRRTAAPIVKTEAGFT